MPFSLFSQINLKGTNKMTKDKKQFIKNFKKVVSFELRWKSFPNLSHRSHSPKKDFEIFIFSEEKTEFSKRIFKAIKHPHFKRNCKTYENSKHLIYCYAMAAEKVIEWEGEFEEAKYIAKWISERIILTLNNFDGEFAYNITLITAEGSNVLIFDPERGIGKAKELKSMIEILAEIS